MSDDQKTPECEALGRVAYEAYAASTDWKWAISGASLPVWSAQHDKVRAAWCAAAHAVREFTRDWDPRA